MIIKNQRFNLKEAQTKLAEIKSFKSPEVPMVREDFKQAVIDNLPRVSNPATKDFMEHLGLGDNKDILPGQLRKEKNIGTYVNRKENSIVEAAIRRDAVLFTVADFGQYMGDNREAKLVELHEKWLLYFETEYKGGQTND